MVTLGKQSSSSNAQSYYQENAQENYYTKDDSYKAHWFGEGAKTLELGKDLKKEDFNNVLHGRNKNGEQLLELKKSDFNKNGDRIRAGQDITFSAPKSISIALEMSKAYDNKKLEKTLLNAHQKAVKTALEHIENDYIATREQINGVRKQIETKNMVAALFVHDTSRGVNQDIAPDLHTHAFVANLTQKKDRTWKSLETKPIFQNQKEIGAYYRSELASNLIKEGFKIEVTDSKQGFYEIDGFTREAIETFSPRREQILEKVEELKKDEKNLGLSDAEIKQKANNKTRESKSNNPSREEILENNKVKFEKLGLNIDFLNNLNKNKEENQNLVTAKNVLYLAIQNLEDKEAVFTKSNLLQEASKISLNYAIPASSIEKELENFKEFELIKLEKDTYTTKKILDYENKIINSLKEGKNKIETNLSKEEAIKKVEKFSKNKEEKGENPLTKGQKKAVVSILSTKDKIIGVQGYAGVGKTTMLKALNSLKDGKTILHGLAFTGKAASEVEKEGLKAETLASFLIREMNAVNNGTLLGLRVKDKDNKIISDEIDNNKNSAKRTNKNAKKISVKNLIKDVSNIPSFLRQKNSLKNFLNNKEGGLNPLLNQEENSVNRFLNGNKLKLGDVIEDEKFIEKGSKIILTVDEASTLNTKDTANLMNFIKKAENLGVDVQLIFIGDDGQQKAVGAGDAFNLLMRNEMNIIEMEENVRAKTELLKEVNKDFHKQNFALAFDRLDKAKKVVQLSDKKAINRIVEDYVKDLKESKDTLIVTTLNEDKNKINESVRKKLKDLSLISKEDFSFTVKDSDEVEAKKDFSNGEKILFGKNDKKINVKNGQTGIIKSISAKGNIVVQMDNKEIKFNIINYPYLQSGYAVTTYKSQGLTSDNVIAYMPNKGINNSNNFYVAVSRAKNDVKIYTDLKKDPSLKNEKRVSQNGLLEKIVKSAQKFNATTYEEQKREEEERIKELKELGNPTKKQRETVFKISSTLNLDISNLKTYKDFSTFIKDNNEAYINKILDNKFEIVKNINDEIGGDLPNRDFKAYDDYIKENKDKISEFRNTLNKVAHIKKFEVLNKELELIDTLKKSNFNLGKEIQEELVFRQIKSEKIEERIEELQKKLRTTQNKTVRERIEENLKKENEKIKNLENPVEKEIKNLKDRLKEQKGKGSKELIKDLKILQTIKFNQQVQNRLNKILNKTSKRGRAVVTSDLNTILSNSKNKNEIKNFVKNIKTKKGEIKLDGYQFELNGKTANLIAGKLENSLNEQKGLNLISKEEFERGIRFAFVIRNKKNQISKSQLLNKGIDNNWLEENLESKKISEEINIIKFNETNLKNFNDLQNILKKEINFLKKEKGNEKLVDIKKDLINQIDFINKKDVENSKNNNEQKVEEKKENKEKREVKNDNLKEMKKFVTDFLNTLNSGKSYDITEMLNNKNLDLTSSLNQEENSVISFLNKNENQIDKTIKEAINKIKNSNFEKETKNIKNKAEKFVEKFQSKIKDKKEKAQEKTTKKNKTKDKNTKAKEQKENSKIEKYNEVKTEIGKDFLGR